MPTSEMTAQFAFRLFPCAERLRRRRQTGGHSKCVQEAVVREREKVSLIDLHCVLKDAGALANLRHGEGLQFQWSRLCFSRQENLAGLICSGEKSRDRNGQARQD